MRVNLNRARRIFQMGVSHLVYSWRFRTWGARSILERPYRLLGARNISIGWRVHIRSGVRFEAFTPTNRRDRPSLTIEDEVSIGQNCHIVSSTHVHIGIGTLIGAGVAIVDREHETGPSEVPPIYRGLVCRPVVIGRNCWIANGAVITAGVSLGEGCTVGANTVVTRDVPPGTVVAGVPARPIGSAGAP